MQLDRRDFLKIAAASAALLGAAPAPTDVRNGIPYRALGKTGESVSLLCVGGYHMGVRQLGQEGSVRLVRTALDEGVNFLDNAWTYHDGRSEEWMGHALKDGYRDKAFLMTKHYTDARDVASMMEQLETSLRRLQVDHLDLWQVHQIHRPDHARKVYENGIPEAMLKAKEQGKVRHIGFTGHSRPEWHLEMIDGGFPWETVQMPINPLDYHWTSFQHSVLPKALEKGIGVIAMKTLGGTPGHIPNLAKALTAEECMHYAMNLPVSTVVVGMDSMERLEAGLAAARSFRPLDNEKVADLLARCKDLADGGRHEPYKDKTV